MTNSVAGAGTPAASPLMADGNERDARNPGGDHEVSRENAQHEHRRGATSDEPAPTSSPTGMCEALTQRQIAGVLTRLSATEDDRGRSVLRAIVDFYDGASPNISFRTIFNATPVTIIEVDPNE